MSEAIKGNWRNHYGFRFMSSEDMEDQQEVTLTISGCTREKAVNPKTKEEKELIALHFEETDRMLALNVTNAKAIQHMVGTPKVDRWAGIQITVYKDRVKAFGETVACLRVKRPAKKRGVESIKQIAEDDAIPETIDTAQGLEAADADQQAS